MAEAAAAKPQSVQPTVRPPASGGIDGLLNPTDRSNTKVAIYKVNKLGTLTREKIREEGRKGKGRTSPPRNKRVWSLPPPQTSGHTKLKRFHFKATAAAPTTPTQRGPNCPSTSAPSSAARTRTLRPRHRRRRRRRGARRCRGCPGRRRRRRRSCTRSCCTTSSSCRRWRPTRCWPWRPRSSRRTRC